MGKWPLGLFGINLGVVENTKLDGIDADFLGDLVNRDLERHQAGRLSRCPHGVALWKIECRQPHRRHAVFTGIKQTCLHDGGLGISTLNVARPALMRDGRDLAVAFGADADALDGRRAVGRVVDEKRARQRDLDRAFRSLGPESGQQGICPQKQLTTETAANERRHQMDFLLVDVERGRQIGSPPVDHLARRPQRQRVAVPCGDRGMRLHH